MATDEAVQNFVSGLDGYSNIKEVEIEDREYGHSIRVTTDFDTEDFKDKLISLHGKLQNRLEQHLDLQNFKERQVFIRIDW